MSGQPDVTKDKVIIHDVQNGKWERIDPRAIKVWRVIGLIWSLVLCIFVAVSIYLTIYNSWITWYITTGLIFIGTVAVILNIFVIPTIRIKIWRYKIEEDEICLQYGILVMTQMLIPMARVQDVSTKQGPILRKYNLATISISTAAGIHEIPALPLDQAKGVRDKIVKMAGVSDDV